MKALVTGDRNWESNIVILSFLDFWKSNGLTEIVEGGAKGADSIAATWAKSIGLEVHEIKADWNKFGRAAGAIRNRQMLKLHPDVEVVFAFHDDLRSSRGTKDMVNYAISKGLPVIRVNSKGEDSLVVGPIQ